MNPAIIRMNFINRETELKVLEEKWGEGRPHLFVIYGKRRVGKTELIKQFIKNKPAVYYLADRRTLRDQLKEVGKLIGSHFNDPLVTRKGFDDWLEVFEYVKRNTKEPFVFAVDEYPYLVETDGATSSLFQKGWDEFLKDSNVFLILSGSSISMMESETLTSKAPLYGRRTGQTLLEPLTFYQAWKFFPNLSFAEFLKIYSIVGGMPAYLLEINAAHPLEENIKKNIFQKTSVLHNEIDFLLKEELREPKNYLTLLKAISWGKTKFGEIMNESGLERNIIHKYLGTLERLRFIEREVPVTEKSLVKSPKGRYRISDPFTKFWFHYVFPFKSNLEIENFEEALRTFRENSASFEAQTFERVCHETLMGIQNRLFPFERVGRWWEKEQEIDLIGFNSATNQIVFGEVKWSEKPLGTNILDELKKKALSVKWKLDKREEYFVLFSKVGFTDALLERARQERNLLLVEQDRVIETR